MSHKARLETKALPYCDISLPRRQREIESRVHFNSVLITALPNGNSSIVCNKDIIEIKGKTRQRALMRS